ncbi:MAG: hypothetical protein ACI90A_000891 [Shewanella sp.]
MSYVGSPNPKHAKDVSGIFNISLSYGYYNGLLCYVSQQLKEEFVIKDKYSSPSTRRKPWIAIGVILSIVLLFWLLLMMMPKGFKSTFEEIGAGKPVLVFVYDPNLAVSSSQTEQMNEARAQLGDNVLFLLARVGTPEGDQLIAKYRAGSAEILLFSPAGNLIKRQFAVRGANELIEWVQL